MAEIHKLRRTEDIPAAIPVKRCTHEASRTINISIYRKEIDDLPDKSDLLLVQTVIIDERREGLLRCLWIELRDFPYHKAEGLCRIRRTIGFRRTELDFEDALEYRIVFLV